MSSTPLTHNTGSRSRQTGGITRLLIALVALGFGVYKIAIGTSELVHGAGLVAGLAITAGILGAVALFTFWAARRKRRRYPSSTAA